jgi:hypothetical protein
MEISGHETYPPRRFCKGYDVPASPHSPPALASSKFYFLYNGPEDLVKSYGVSMFARVNSLSIVLCFAGAVSPPQTTSDPLPSPTSIHPPSYDGQLAPKVRPPYETMIGLSHDQTAIKLKQALGEEDFNKLDAWVTKHNGQWPAAAKTTSNGSTIDALPVISDSR